MGMWNAHFQKATIGMGLHRVLPRVLCHVLCTVM
jgi:hypothetical protein